MILMQVEGLGNVKANVSNSQGVQDRRKVTEKKK